MTDIEKRCAIWSNRVQWLLIVLIVCHVALFAILLAKTAVAPRQWKLIVISLLVVSWLVWLVLAFSNWNLVRCGLREVRWKYSSRFINHPNPYVRLSLHLLTNWSAIALTLVTAWFLRDSFLGQKLAWLSVTAAVFVWVSFNLLHRQFNRAKNLAFSTAIAVCLIGIATWLSG